MNTLKQTPLFHIHQQLGAKMVDFGGWNMPIQYNSIIEEHKNTRQNVGLFDVSHMGQFIVKGKGATPFLQYLTTNNIQKLYDGKAQYSALLYHNGTFVDDIIVYRINENEYQICVNASNIEKDFLWLQPFISQFDVEVKNISSQVALLAIQGPQAIHLMQKIFDSSIQSISYYEFVKKNIDGYSYLLARMGYTGEDGFELFIPANQAPHWWNKILEIGQEHSILPVGLGARDTLRLEAGFSLYGNDIDDKHTPLQAGLAWITDFNKDFIGKDALLLQKKQGVLTKKIALQLLDKGIPRQHFNIYANNTFDNLIGEVCSGTFSPLLNQGIAMAYVSTQYDKLDNIVYIDIRNKLIPAKITKLPFIKKG